MQSQPQAPILAATPDHRLPLRRRRAGCASPSRAVWWRTHAGAIAGGSILCAGHVHSAGGCDSQLLSEQAARRTALTRARRHTFRSGRMIGAPRTPYGAMNDRLRPWPPSRVHGVLP